jgi:DNA-binding protein HU-beta
MKDLVEVVANNTNVSKKQAKDNVTAVIEAIQQGLAKDGKVQIREFGTFKVVTRKAREGRNPQTGAAIQIAEKQVVKFTPAK